MGKVYLNLAKRSIDPENNVYMAKAIDKVMEKYSDLQENQFDLVLDEECNQLMERKKGKVDFKSQFILMDLLKLFMNSPGEVFSKEALVEKVWKQDYAIRASMTIKFMCDN
ncbi:MAG: winged helix-turn-helix domain-containing protein [Bdellovibrionales bacterium]